MFLTSFTYLIRRSKYFIVQMKRLEYSPNQSSNFRTRNKQSNCFVNEIIITLANASLKKFL